MHIIPKNLKDGAEKRLIEDALIQAKGNKKKAAHSLGMKRSLLYYKMKKLGIKNGQEK